MTIFRVSVRSFVHRLSPVLGVILLAMLFVGGVHHHADARHDACVVCAASHSPAIATAPSPRTVAPTDHFVAVTPAVERAPYAARLETAPSRAPPSA